MDTYTIKPLKWEKTKGGYQTMARNVFYRIIKTNDASAVYQWRSEYLYPSNNLWSCDCHFVTLKEGKEWIEKEHEEFVWQLLVKVKTPK